MKALKLFSISRVFESNKGESFRLHMDLFLLPDAVANKRQLSQYRLSWTFFNSENPDLRILMDNHEPIGLHVHIDKGPQISISAQTITDAQQVFVEMVKKHFDFDLEV